MGAVEKFFSLIREWHRQENEQVTQGISPAAEAICAEIADLEALIVERAARATTLRQVVEDLRQRQANLQRATARRGATPDVALPAEEAYRAAVSDINAALQGSNVEAVRAALRSLLGSRGDVIAMAATTRPLHLPH